MLDPIGSSSWRVDIESFGRRKPHSLQANLIRKLHSLQASE